MSDADIPWHYIFLPGVSAYTGTSQVCLRLRRPAYCVCTHTGGDNKRLPAVGIKQKPQGGMDPLED